MRTRIARRFAFASALSDSSTARQPLGMRLRVRPQDAAALRSVLERHGASVTPGTDDGVLYVADLGATRIAQLAAIHGISVRPT